MVKKKATVTRLNNSDSAPDLGVRVTPVQERSKKTVEQILVATADLLEEVGIDGFNTNLLAERSLVRVRTVYRYFPNKLAVIMAFQQSWMVRAIKVADIFEEMSDPDSDWREVIDRVFASYIDLTQKQKGYVALRRALRSIPELLEAEEAGVYYGVELIIKVMKSRGLPFSDERMRAISRIIIENVLQLTDVMCTDGKPYAEEVYSEGKILLYSYLANYLD